MPTIWVSLNFDLRMTAPLTGAVYPRLSLDRGSLRTGGARRRRIKPKVDSPGRKQTVWHLFVDARLKTVASLRIPGCKLTIDEVHWARRDATRGSV